MLKRDSISGGASIVINGCLTLALRVAMRLFLWSCNWLTALIDFSKEHFAAGKMVRASSAACCSQPLAERSRYNNSLFGIVKTYPRGRYRDYETRHVKESNNNNNIINITSMSLKSSEARAQKRNKIKSVIIFKSRGHAGIIISFKGPPSI